MARFGRRSNHWRWQPRSANGRWASSGGDGQEPGWLYFVTYVVWTAAMWWLFGWVAGVSLLAIVIVLFGVLAWMKRK